MEWAAIITLLLQIFGPLLAEIARRWLDGRLAEAAAQLPPVLYYASEAAARDALFAKAIELERRPLRRFLLRRLKAHAAALDVSVGDTVPPVPEAVAAELRDFPDDD
jgi:hypothetical protein